MAGHVDGAQQLPPNLRPHIGPPAPGYVQSHDSASGPLIDAALGDPEWLYRAIAHPTVLAGRLIDWL